MELTRDNFIKMMLDNEIFFSQETPFFNKKGSELMKLINQNFFDNTLMFALNTDINEIVQPSLKFQPTDWYKNEYSNKWLENFYQIDVIYMWEYLLIDYFTRAREKNFIILLKFLRDSKDVTDAYSEHFKKFYHWFIAHFMRLVKPDFLRHSNEFYEKRNVSVLAISYERIFAFDTEPVIEYYNNITNSYVKYKVEKIFGAYFESIWKYYIMYENGKVVDKISSRRFKFDPILHMLTNVNKTM